MINRTLRPFRVRAYLSLIAIHGLPSILLAQGGLDQVLEWNLEKTFQMGSYDAPGFDFSLVTDLATDMEGRIVVLDRLGPTVRVFSRDGEFIQELGGRGDGPGEFRMPFRVGLIGDSLWVTDGRLFRVTFYTQDLELIGTIPARSPPSPGLRQSAPSAVLKDGSLVFQGTLSLISMKAGNSALLPVLVVSPNLKMVDTLAVFDYGKRFFPLEAGGMLSVQENPFSPRDEWAASRNGLKIALLRQEPEVQEITVRDLDGQHRTTTFQNPGPVLPRREIVNWTAEQAERIAMGRAGLVSEISESILEGVGHPVRAPVFERILVEDSGAVWLQVWDLPGSPEKKKRWIILSPDLKPAGSIALPSRAVLLDVQCRAILVAEYDELDVPFLAGHTVNPGRPWCGPTARRDLPGGESH